MGKIQRGELSGALDAVKGAIAAKGIVPILTHVLVDGTTVIGFDSQIGIRVTMTQDVGARFCLPYEKFAALVRQLDKDEVELNVEGSKVTLKCGTHTSTLVQMTEEFPKLDAKTDGTWHNVPAGLKEAVERASIACAQSEKVQTLSNVYFKGARVYGTTGQEAVRCTLKDWDVPPFLLGKKGVDEVIRLGNPVRLMISDPWAIWDYANLMLFTRLKEGADKYPPVDRLFADGRDAKATKIPNGLLAALSRLSIFLDDKAAVYVEGGLVPGLTAKGEGADLNEYVDDVCKADQPRKGFSPFKLSKALPYADVLEWGGGNDTIYLKGGTSGFEYVLAPFR